jgi:hypothetical protein
MKAILPLVLSAAILALSHSDALADKRGALVIGNSAYQNVARLANPASDATAMAETFRGANFDIVESHTDLSAAEMRRTLRDFADKARDADVPERICPLVCDPGYRADGERCTRITCRAGFEVGDDNSCERTSPSGARLSANCGPSAARSVPHRSHGP